MTDETPTPDGRWVMPDPVFRPLPRQPLDAQSYLDRRGQVFGNTCRVWAYDDDVPSVVAGMAELGWRFTTFEPGREHRIAEKSTPPRLWFMREARTQ